MGSACGLNRPPVHMYIFIHAFSSLHLLIAHCGGVARGDVCTGKKMFCSQCKPAMTKYKQIFRCQRLSFTFGLETAVFIFVAYIYFTVFIYFSFSKQMILTYSACAVLLHCSSEIIIK